MGRWNLPHFNAACALNGAAAVMHCHSINDARIIACRFYIAVSSPGVCTLHSVASAMQYRMGTASALQSRMGTGPL